MVVGGRSWLSDLTFASVPPEPPQGQQEARDSPGGDDRHVEAQGEEARPLPASRSACAWISGVSGQPSAAAGTTSGNRSAEKNIPEPIHIGSITALIRPEMVSIVRARLATEQADAREVQRAQHDQQPDRQVAPLADDAEDQPGEDQEDEPSVTREHQPADEQGGQEVAAFHGRGHVTLEQLADPHLDDPEAHAPQAAAHQAHPQQPGHEEIDVASARLVDQLVFDRGGVAAAGGPLEDVVGRVPRQTLSVRVGIVVVFVAGRRLGRRRRSDRVAPGRCGAARGPPRPGRRRRGTADRR